MFEELDHSIQLMQSAHADALRRIGELDEQRAWRRDGATCMTSWLSARYALTWATAQECVRVARTLRSLPKIAAAHARGELSWDQLRPLTKFASSSEDERWAAEGTACSPAWLWREARRHERLREEEEAEIHRSRSLSFEWNEEKTALYLSGRLGAEQGAALQRAVLDRSEQVVLADDPWDPAEARLADALVELVTSSGERDSAPTLVIHADAGVLAAETERGLAETESSAQLGSDAVRRLACDARIEWVLERDGRPIGLGRRGRVVRGQLARVLRHRDQNCRFPGCARKKWLKAHHLVHWARGGETDLENLVLLCHAHHRLLHEGGWRTSGRPDRGLRFHDPTGRPLRALSERTTQAALAEAVAVSAAG